MITCQILTFTMECKYTKTLHCLRKISIEMRLACFEWVDVKRSKHLKGNGATKWWALKMLHKNVPKVCHDKIKSNCMAVLSSHVTVNGEKSGVCNGNMIFFTGHSTRSEQVIRHVDIVVLNFCSKTFLIFLQRKFSSFCEQFSPLVSNSEPKKQTNKQN